jgi:hypothetical protein
MSHYTLEYGSYYLREDHNNAIISTTDQVAIAFDATMNVMLKHGPPEHVMQWWEENKKKAPGLFDDIQVMKLPRGAPVEEINRVLSTAGYIGVLRKKIDDGTLELLPVEGPRQG